MWDEESSAAAQRYSEAVDHLVALRLQRAAEEEIAAAKAREQEAWAEVKKLVPDAFCR